MKTKLSILLAFAALLTQAASIDWTISGTGVVKDADNNPLSGAKLYLISAADTRFLSAEYNSLDDFMSALESVTINSTYALDNAGQKPTVTKVPVSSSTLMTAGTKMTFGLLVLDTSNGVSYRMMTAEGTPYADGASADAHTTLTTPIGRLASNTSSPWTQANVAVPEPSTAALALAGLALLLKRRKA